MIALIILVVFGLLTMFAGFSKSRILTKSLAILGLGAALFGACYEVFLINYHIDVPFLIAFQYRLNTMMYFNHFSVGFSIAMIFAGLMIAIISQYPSKKNYPWNEFYPLIFFSLIGGICMVSYAHLLMLFLGIEILSIPLYVLAASDKENLSSNEAGLKYFLMGSFATGILLFGIALVYGAVGHLEINSINAFLTSTPINATPNIFWVGMVMMIIGMFFKISAVPFHFWSPDVYQGSPNIVTMFMATVVKTAAFGAFIVLMKVYFNEGAAPMYWKNLFIGIAVITLFVSNITAIYQSSVKRMLAYSSISQVGYLLMVLISPMVFYHAAAVSVFYLVSYAAATIILFSGMILVSEASDDYSFSAYNGLGQKKPMLAAFMTIAMISLAGIPLTAGFFGKYFIITSILHSNIELVFVILANSAISIYYYFRLINAMYFQPANEFEKENITFPFSFQFAMIIALCIIIGFALMPIDVIQAFLPK